jgi:hypothetical protein
LFAEVQKGDPTLADNDCEESQIEKLARCCYASTSYLNDWVGHDRKFHETLSIERSYQASREAGATTLAEVAKEYSVIRNFKKIDETERLGHAYEKLLEISRPLETEVGEVVDRFAKVLGETYGTDHKVKLLSAASKFLWMRFRSPIIIYDTLAWNWLQKRSPLKSTDDYSGYMEVWRSTYSQYREAIAQGCSGLVAIKKFTLGWNLTDSLLESWTSSEWFHHRVFDYLIIDPDIHWAEN